MKRWYFAYGMNTNINGMAQRCPQAKCMGPVVLPDHKFVFRYHADIEQSPGNLAHGVLWEITEDCERSLDTLEGYPYYYDKKEVIVESLTEINGMNRFVAMVYYMTDQTAVGSPAEYYLNSVLEGYKENNVNIDQIHQALEECKQHEKVS